MFAMICNWFIKKYKIFIQKECSPKRLAVSCCLGVYIAFSPFVGLHTAMVFLFSWAFALNFAVLLGVSCLINNPWTMVPIYITDYMFGNWLFGLLRIDSMWLNPQWLCVLNQWLARQVGFSGVSLCSFLVGGNLLGIAIGGILYPVLIRVFVAKKP